MPIASKSFASRAMPGDFAVPSAAKVKNILASRLDLRVLPPSHAAKRLPGVAGSPPQDARLPGLSVFWRLIGGDETRFRAHNRGEDQVKSTGFEHDEIQCDQKPFLVVPININSR